jgi:hypothetical protein
LDFSYWPIAFGDKNRTCLPGRLLLTIICELLITFLSSLFPTAGKVTKRAAAADKRLKINSCDAKENKLGRRHRPQTYFLANIRIAGKPACHTQP